MTAEIQTEKGVMKVEFFEKDAPNTVKNFTDLAKKGFYDGLTFHRVIPNFRGMWYGTNKLLFNAVFFGDY